MAADTARGDPGPRTPRGAPPGRRSFLNWLLGTWAGAVLAAIGFPVVRYMQPPEIPEPTTRTAVGGPAATLAPNSYRIIPFGASPAIIIRLPSGDLRAFSAVCTHLSCTVQFRQDLQQIWCACHNGHYDLHGRNVSGPPPRPLEEYDVADRDGQIVVSRRT
jgi:cytochrome b6-f complex iron-sulfur subunit